MLGIASSITDSTATAGTRILAPRQTMCGLGHDMATAVDGGRPRAPEARISPKVISERIGHANVRFFMQTYAYVLRNDDRDAAERAAAFLIGNSWDPADAGDR